MAESRSRIFATAEVAMKHEMAVKEGGRAELRVPLPVGSHVTVFVVPEQAEPADDILSAAQSSLDFWDNPLDDEDWNNA